MPDKWEQAAIRHPDRVRHYIERVYGAKGFEENGNIKPQYLEMAEMRAQREGEHSLVKAIVLARTLKAQARERVRA